MNIRKFVGAAVCLLLGVNCALAAEKISPVGGPWEAGKFKFDRKENKTRRSLSGIACPGMLGDGAKCLVVFDEGTVAHYVKLGPEGYAIDNSVVTLSDSGGELDAEAAATDGKHYYVTGSHSAKRGNCDSNPDSRHLIRFEVGADGGAELVGNKLAGYADTDAIWRLMFSKSEFKDHVGERKCLGTEPPPDAKDLRGQRGVNIEGLAAKDGLLHFGFRGPVSGGIAPILSVDAKAVFEANPPSGRVTMLRIGEGLGIRDLAPARGGVLVLAGPDDDGANAGRAYVVALWDGQVQDGVTVKPQVLAELDLTKVDRRDCDKELKPEALAVIKDTDKALELVIMSDGMCDGGPLKFEIFR
jgi:hypothetical protein